MSRTGTTDARGGAHPRGVRPRGARPASAGDRDLREPAPAGARAGDVLGRLLGGLFGAVARLRGDRALHPDGITVRGRLERHGVPGGSVPSGVAWLDTPGDEDVVVRLSRGGGLPTWLPDVQGLALRCAAGDVLLSSSGAVPVLRHAPGLHGSPSTAFYGSVIPFAGPRGPVLLAARAVDAVPRPAAPDELLRSLGHRPMVLALLRGAPRGPWHVVGRLTLGGTTAPDVRFDPADAPTGLGTYPLVARLRARAYARSQEVPAPPDPGSTRRNA